MAAQLFPAAAIGQENVPYVPAIVGPTPAGMPVVVARTGATRMVALVDGWMTAIDEGEFTIVRQLAGARVPHRIRVRYQMGARTIRPDRELLLFLHPEADGSYSARFWARRERRDIYDVYCLGHTTIAEHRLGRIFNWTDPDDSAFRACARSL